jgi:hypothetical protein
MDFFLLEALCERYKKMLASTNFYQKVTKIVGATLRKVSFSFFPLAFFPPSASYY